MTKQSYFSLYWNNKNERMNNKNYKIFSNLHSFWTPFKYCINPADFICLQCNMTTEISKNECTTSWEKALKVFFRFRQQLTHLWLMFHYWKGNDVGVIILLVRVIAEVWFFTYVCLLWVHVITWCTDLVTAADTGVQGGG